MIDHCGLIWGRIRPKLSLGCRANNVIIPLDLTPLFCPGFMLTAGPPSGFTTDIVGCWGKPCGEPAISLHSYTVSLVQWVNPLLPIMRDQGSIPKGVIMWNRDSPVSVVSLHWWPDVIDHYGLVWGGLCPEPSLGCRVINVIIPLDLTQLFCPGSCSLQVLLPVSLPT